LTNVIVFDYTKVGVNNTHAANLFYNVHTWNGGGIGIVSTSYQTRFIGCYLDYNYLLLIDPQQVVVESGFFLETNVVIQAGSRAMIDGVAFRFNTWSSGYVPTISGTFTTCRAFTLNDDFQSPVHTIVRQNLTMERSNIYTLDFSKSLILPRIDFVETTFVQSEQVQIPMPPYVYFPSPMQVSVVFVQPVSGTVYITVSQCL
jgi:hypothetical protein